MSWRDVLVTVPSQDAASQYSQYPQNRASTEVFGDCEDIGEGSGIREATCIEQLRQQARRARDWDDLYSVLDDAQVAYDAGEVSRDEVQALLGYATGCSRSVPEQVGGIPKDCTLSELLAERPIVRVRSRLLGEVLVWVADGVQLLDDTLETVYRESELRRLVGRSAAEVKAVHEIKRALDGELFT